MSWGDTLWGYVAHPETIFGISPVTGGSLGSNGTTTSVDVPGESKTGVVDSFASSVGTTIGKTIGTTASEAIRPVFFYLVVGMVIYIWAMKKL